MTFGTYIEIERERAGVGRTGGGVGSEEKVGL